MVCYIRKFAFALPSLTFFVVLIYLQTSYVIRRSALDDTNLGVKIDDSDWKEKSIPESTLQESPSNPLPDKLFSYSGLDINCRQTPLNNISIDHNSTLNKKFAFAWYSATIEYACSALVALKNLKIVRNQKDGNGFQVNADYVVVYAEENFVDGRAKKMMTSILENWEKEGGIVRKFESLMKFTNNVYYRGALEKFNTFLLTNYDRVIVMDSDGLAFHNIDHLFGMSFPDGVHIAAPQGYWFEKQGILPAEIECHVHPRNGIQVAITSAFLVINPGVELYERVKPYFGKFMKWSRHEYFDMDVINQEFSCKHEVLVLPKMYGTLDSEFVSSKPLSKRMEECKDFSKVQYMHFSGLQKPWMWGRGGNPELDEAAFEVKTVVKDWIRVADEVCPWLFEKTS